MQFAQELGQFARIRRLREMSIEAGPHRLFPVLLLTETGEGHDNTLFPLLTNREHVS